MTPEDLMDAIGECDDRHIAQAGVRPKRFRWRRVLAACLVLALGLTLGLGLGGNAGGGSTGDLEYMYYTGPILPLTAREVETVTAQRHTELDFSPYTGDRWDAAAIARDTYTLTSPEAQTVTLLYPMGAALSGSLEHPPEVFVDGQAVPLTQYAGSGLEWGSFADCEALFPAYLDTVFDAFPDLSREVIVYRLTESQGKLVLEYRADPEKSLVCDYGANGGSYGMKGVNRLEFDEPDAEHCLVVFGEDLQDCTIVQGDCTITREVMPLEEILGILTDRALESAETIWERPMPDRELCLGLLAEYLDARGMLQAPEGEYQAIYSLGDVFGMVLAEQYVFYWAFEVTLPAGEAVTVEAVTYREAHADYAGKKRDRDGYDLATTLGSNLQFTEQTLSVTNVEAVELAGDNCGFDWKHGITQVTLDLQQQHYWLQIRKKS